MENCNYVDFINSENVTKELLLQNIQEITRLVYDFSLIPENLNGITTIKLICKKHGEFEVSIEKLLTSEFGIVCDDCVSDKKEFDRLKRFRSFLIDCRKQYGNKYDYSMIQYVDQHQKAEIICPIHGVFSQYLQEHKKGHGCPRCSDNFRVSDTETFIRKARKVHGDKYDYSLVEYVNNQTKVKIICPKHGVFEQTPASHLNGTGCNKCAHDKCILSTEEFIKKAKKVHGDKYDYSLVEYINTNTKVKIICPKHGVFEQVPYNHLSKKGCPHCANNQKISTNEFIRRAREIHGDIYDYSKVNYVKNSVKVEIICREHGSFMQKPCKHIQKRNGCPICALHNRTSKLQKDVFDYLDEHNIEYRKEEKYPWLKYIGPMSLDCFLPEYNVVIEVHGKQHFQRFERDHSPEDLKLRKERDRTKNQLCKEHGIKIYYIAERMFDENYPLGHLYTNIEEMVNDIIHDSKTNISLENIDN